MYAGIANRALFFSPMLIRFDGIPKALTREALGVLMTANARGDKITVACCKVMALMLSFLLAEGNTPSRGC